MRSCHVNASVWGAPVLGTRMPDTEPTRSPSEQPGQVRREGVVTGEVDGRLVRAAAGRATLGAERRQADAAAAGTGGGEHGVRGASAGLRQFAQHVDRPGGCPDAAAFRGDQHEGLHLHAPDRGGAGVALVPVAEGHIEGGAVG